MLRWRIPRLHEEIVDAGLINRADRGIRIRVSRQQRSLGVRKDLPGRLQKTDAIHVRHALIGQQQGDSIVADFELFQKIKRGYRRSLLSTRYSAPYCVRRSRSIARKTSGSSSTVNRMGFAMMKPLMQYENCAFTHAGGHLLPLEACVQDTDVSFVSD